MHCWPHVFRNVLKIVKACYVWDLFKKRSCLNLFSRVWCNYDSFCRATRTPAAVVSHGIAESVRVNKRKENISLVLIVSFYYVSQSFSKSMYIYARSAFALVCVLYGPFLLICLPCAKKLFGFLLTPWKIHCTYSYWLIVVRWRYMVSHYLKQYWIIVTGTSE